MKKGNEGKVQVGLLQVVTFILLVTHNYFMDFITGRFWERGQLP
jgi:hypothetical protein